MRIGFNAAAALLLASALLAAQPGHAAAESFSAEYSVSFLGFTVAKSTFNSRISGTQFYLEGQIASAGLGAIFDSTHGKTVAYGSFTKNATRPDVYTVDYSYGKTAKRTAMSFTEGKLTGLVNTPELPPRQAGWIYLQEAEVRSVVDPISATLVRASSPAGVCKRTIQIFDGEFRADIVLSPAKSKPETPGFDKGTVACVARLVPVSGYHAGNGSLDYLRSKSRMQITFAPLGKTGVYAPVYASVGTQLGPVTIRAKRISTSQ